MFWVQRNNNMTQSGNNIPIPQPTNKRKIVNAWIWLIASVIYTFSPVDLLPDIPFVGWFDDFFLLSAAVLNLLQAQMTETHLLLAKTLKMLKWIMLVLGIIIILLILLLGTLIVSMVAKR